MKLLEWPLGDESPASNLVRSQNREKMIKEPNMIPSIFKLERYDCLSYSYFHAMNFVIEYS